MPLGLRNVPTQLIVLTNNFSSELLISFHMGAVSSSLAFTWALSHG